MAASSISSTSRRCAPWRASVSRRGARSPSYSGPAIVGSLDSILDGKCFGWALVEDQESPVYVQIAVDGSIVAEGTADQFRPDLLEAGRSTGHCAFVIDLPTEVRDGRFADPNRTDLLRFN